MLLLIYSIFFSTYYMPGPVLSQGNIFPKGHLAIPGDVVREGLRRIHLSRKK